MATIWFACKGCGKRHRRPETAAGTMVFCSCGEGNRVPWESTAPPEEAEETPGAPDPVAEEEAPPPRRRAEKEAPLPRRRRRTRAEPRDPSRCLNHTETPSARTCAACGEAFCDNCVVTVQDRTLCGPCKNFDLRAAQRPRSPSGLAIVSLCLGLIGNPIAFCSTVTAMGVQPGASAGAFVASLVCLVPPLAAVAAGMKALRAIDKRPRLGGQAMAVLGMVTGGVGVLWCLTLLLILTVRAAQGE